MIAVIDLIVDLLTLIIILHVILSYALSPYHPVREALDRVVEPMLMPIRRVLPYTGCIDFSPVILLLLVQLIGRLLIGVLS
jgi:YggT family protein